MTAKLPPPFFHDRLRLTARLALLWLLGALGSLAQPAVNVPDDALYTAVLREHVHQGMADYRRLARDERLDRYLAQLAAFDPDTLPSRDAQLALWINAYNAYTLKLITSVYPVESIRLISDLGRTTTDPEKGRPWDIPFARVGGHDYTLEQIEHEVIRPRFRDGRIHFALVCAAVSCPKLRDEAFTGPALDQQLNDQGRWFLTHRNRLDGRRRQAELSQIFSWFADDFGSSSASRLDYIAQFVTADLAKSLREQPERWTITYADYDWALNEHR